MSTNQDGMQTDRNPGSLPLKESSPVKKSYRDPTLIEYGTVSRLTRFTGGTMSPDGVNRFTNDVGEKYLLANLC